MFEFFFWTCPLIIYIYIYICIHSFWRPASLHETSWNLMYQPKSTFRKIPVSCENIVFALKHVFLHSSTSARPKKSCSWSDRTSKSGLILRLWFYHVSIKHVCMFLEYNLCTVQSIARSSLIDVDMYLFRGCQLYRNWVAKVGASGWHQSWLVK